MARKVVISGATGGIGSALVAAFLANGDEVVAIDRVHGDAASNLTWVLADFATLGCDDEAAADLSTRLVAVLNGQCDVLINNAATQHVGHFAELPMTAWNDTLAVNLLAPVVLIRSLLPLMETGKGTVINISSIHAHLTKPGFTAYATSKAALSGLTRALAVELGRNIRVVAIEPAAISTPMLKEGFAGNPTGYAQLESMHPSGRIGSPNEVAELALTICRPGLGFINGVAIGIDGGIASRLHDPA